MTEEEDGGGTAGLSGQRVCYKHERAIPIQPTVESLDMREEGEEEGGSTERGLWVIRPLNR